MPSSPENMVPDGNSAVQARTPTGNMRSVGNNENAVHTAMKLQLDTVGGHSQNHKNSHSRHDFHDFPGTGLHSLNPRVKFEREGGWGKPSILIRKSRVPIPHEGTYLKHKPDFKPPHQRDMAKSFHFKL